jgi:ABC-type multidrug transport system ATPase subunit
MSDQNLTDYDSDPPPTEAETAAEQASFFTSPGRGWWSRLKRLAGSRERMRLLPVLIKVYAGFSKMGGLVAEEEIESSLGFLRYDYPEAMYSHLQEMYRVALREPQDLNQMAQELATQLSVESKILLAVQVYLLISHNKIQGKEVTAFHRFMTSLGVAHEAQGIVHQLAPDEELPVEEGVATPLLAAMPDFAEVLETLEIRPAEPADLTLEMLGPCYGVSVFRYRGLMLLKNIGQAIVIARGHQLRPGQFLRLYEGQRVVLGDTVLDYQDLAFYLNAKKGVSSTQLFVSLGSSDHPFVEKVRTKLSVLRLRFGLQVEVEALQDCALLVAGRVLPKGRKLRVHLSEKIQFADRSEISISELKRRARELGGRFDLNTSKNEYLISNNPALLQKGDILLSPALRSEILLRIRCDYDNKRGELEVLRAARVVLVDRQPVKDKAVLEDGATILLGEGQCLRCHFAERIIEEDRNIIRQLDVQNVSHSYGKKSPALDGVSFTARRGELICVMGPSGCGKSSLLRVLAGHQKPLAGGVQLNGLPLYENLRKLTEYISYIPHEEAFDPMLTVEENVAFASQLRSPHLAHADLHRRVEAKLVELGLYERRKGLAGTPEEKRLSGGERKRLNVGMDMIAPADIFLFDEPTSGLSSKDSEHVLEIIRGLSHNKIVFVSIHQPSSRLFHLFHKALLLDKGGKVVFYGKPQEMLDYFHGAWQDEIVKPLAESGRAGGTPVALPTAEINSPEFIFDVLETPLRDLGGDVIFEEDARRHTAPARRFPPNFWRDRYQTYSLFKEVKEPKLRRAAETGTEQIAPATIDSPRPVRDRGVVLSVMLKRAFLSKFRNRSNLATTLLEAPMLAILIAYVLRFAEDGEYTFAAAFHVPTYLFLTLVVGMFLGLSNSADEIIRDRILLQRERNYNRNVGGYVLSKFLALAAVSLIQDVIYLGIGNSILEVRDMFGIYLGWMFLTSICGVATGLLISSLVRDGKTAINIIPLLLIPQIILGGALIKYEEMNRNLDFVYSIRRWISSDQIREKEPSKLRVPVICEFMPLRWVYEGLVLAQYKGNPYDSAQNEIDDRVHELSGKTTLTVDEEKQLTQLKEALAFVSGLEERSPDAVKRRLDRIMDDVTQGTFDAEKHRPKNLDESVSAEEIYQNKKISDLVHNAEFERTDVRNKGQKPNVFFGTRKRYLGGDHSTLMADAIVILAFVIGPLLLVYVALRKQLRRV